MFRVRFAPSPTGYLHVGNARTAIFNYLLARKNNGQFILRIEDTDFERSSKEYENQLLKDLMWLGLDWDEGPDTKNQPFGPYRQSERFDIYKEYTEKLLKEGKAYRCYCTQEELENMRKECLAKGRMPKYNGRCRNLTEEQIRKFENEGRKPTIRFKVEEGINIVIDDLIRGKVEFNSSNIGGDFIIVRSEGIPVYNYIVVIDDYLMKITHVIRGDDHLSNTPKQILVAKALNIPIPKYAHHPLILGPDRSKLSKRHGITSVAKYREQGYLPEALFNYLSLLGWSSEDGKELFSKEELIEAIDISRIGKSAAVFDFQKLKWMNGIYIRNYEINKLTELLKDFLKDYNLEEYNNNWLKKFTEVIRGNLEILADVREWASIFFNEEIQYEDDAIKLLKNSEINKIIPILEEKLKNIDSLNDDTYIEIFKEIIKETKIKGKKLFMPVRALFTGKTSGPDLQQTLILIGKDKLLKRIELWKTRNGN